MIRIVRLDYEQYAGKEYEADVFSDAYLDIEPQDEGFSLKWVKTSKEFHMPLKDAMLSDWLENPVAYGAFEGSNLLGFVEGFLEKWNNRFRVTNICVFDTSVRRAGLGKMLLESILIDAEKSDARMIVLETQSFNSVAISFYQKNGFEIIGFDRFAYSNEGPAEHNMRIEMGKKYSISLADSCLSGWKIRIFQRGRDNDKRTIDNQKQ